MGPAHQVKVSNGLVGSTLHRKCFYNGPPMAAEFQETSLTSGTQVLHLCTIIYLAPHCMHGVPDNGSIASRNNPHDNLHSPTQAQRAPGGPK